MSATRAPTDGAPVLRKYGRSSQLSIFLLLLLSLAAPPPSGAFAPLCWNVPLAANSIGQRPSAAAAGAARSLRMFGGGKLHGSAASSELGSSICEVRQVGGSFSLKTRRRAHVAMAAAGSSNGETAVVSSTTNPQEHPSPFHPLIRSSTQSNRNLQLVHPPIHLQFACPARRPCSNTASRGVHVVRRRGSSA